VGRPEIDHGFGAHKALPRRELRKMLGIAQTAHLDNQFASGFIKGVFLAGRLRQPVAQFRELHAESSQKQERARSAQERSVDCPAVSARAPGLAANVPADDPEAFS